MPKRQQHPRTKLPISDTSNRNMGLELSCEFELQKWIRPVHDEPSPMVVIPYCTKLHYDSAVFQLPIAFRFFVFVIQIIRNKKTKCALTGSNAMVEEFWKAIERPEKEKRYRIRTPTLYRKSGFIRLISLSPVLIIFVRSRLRKLFRFGRTVWSSLSLICTTHVDALLRASDDHRPASVFGGRYRRRERCLSALGGGKRS